MGDTMKKQDNPLLSNASSVHETSASNSVSRQVVNSLLAGSMAGITSTLMGHPFDVLRTKMQSHDTTGSSRQQVLSRTIRFGGGVRALYTGLSLPLAAQAVYKATVFTVNKSCQQFLLSWQGPDYQLSLFDFFVCGAMGGAVNAALFVTPVEFVRNQLIAQHSKLTHDAAAAKNTSVSPLSQLSSPRDVLRNTFVREGLSGLWRGASVTVARDSLGCGLFFYAFHSSQQFLQDSSQKPKFGYTLISGAIAGLGFWVAALPLDTVKTLVQNGSAPTARAVIRDSLETVGFWQTLLRSCRGWQFAFGRGAPAAAVTLGTYDICYRALENGQ